MNVVPYKESQDSKKEQVADMFNNISHRYDMLNHLLSFGIDRIWRKKTIKQLEKLRPKTILDVATGTGDLAIEALHLNPEKIIGIDISEGMLQFAEKKIKAKKTRKPKYPFSWPILKKYLLQKIVLMPAL